nr:MAG TPA: hypothetical protein [Caudoviricetes sp.]
MLLYKWRARLFCTLSILSKLSSLCILKGVKPCLKIIH